MRRTVSARRKKTLNSVNPPLSLSPLFVTLLALDATKEIGKLEWVSTGKSGWKSWLSIIDSNGRTHSIGAHYFSCISTVLSANFLSVTISIIDSSGTHEVHALRNIFPFHWCVVFQCLLFFPANFLSCVSSIVIHWYKTNDSWLGSDMCRKPVTVFSLCLTLRPIWFVDIF